MYGSIPLGENVKRILITLAETAIYLTLYILQEIYLPLSAMREDSFYSEHSYWYVLLYVPVSVTITRAKYYGAWKLSMCGVHSSGISYNGHNFRRINTVNPVIVETTPHVR